MDRRYRPGMAAREGDQILIDLLDLRHTLAEGCDGAGLEIDTLHEASIIVR
jgi:hypothetical protein